MGATCQHCVHQRVVLLRRRLSGAWSGRSGSCTRQRVGREFEEAQTPPSKSDLSLGKRACALDRARLTPAKAGPTNTPRRGPQPGVGPGCDRSCARFCSQQRATTGCGQRLGMLVGPAFAGVKRNTGACQRQRDERSEDSWCPGERMRAGEPCWVGACSERLARVVSQKSEGGDDASHPILLEVGAFVARPR